MRIAAAASSSIVRAWTAVGRWPREDVEKRQREVLLGKAQKVRNEGSLRGALGEPWVFFSTVEKNTIKYQTSQVRVQPSLGAPLAQNVDAFVPEGRDRPCRSR